GELMEKVLLPKEVIFNREKGIFQWKSPHYSGGEQDMVIHNDTQSKERVKIEVEKSEKQNQQVSLSVKK
ncbi:MAG: hypothetical protein ABSA74_03140, partial [Candidatus Staskawiczbacteria bacterium]